MYNPQKLEPHFIFKGVTKVSYIQGPEESENTPSNITLPTEVDQENREACTLKTNVELKTEPEEVENNENIFIIEEDEGNINNANMGAIADAVKATLANQPGNGGTFTQFITGLFHAFTRN